MQIAAIITTIAYVATSVSTGITYTGTTYTEFEGYPLPASTNGCVHSVFCEGIFKSVETFEHLSIRLKPRKSLDATLELIMKLV
ncbi:hypothetical protein HYALB_00000701 [Hymenoscyphus albidus]|uniref:Uncharacterized protein n=1 Tax=Hymenoscyphus albidus TaxID=595503 RepID=A0A9N9Q8N1_9HELO|nr:hypothetical protein HYALB_00000701 [Hymenoscyphus albidus]